MKTPPLAILIAICVSGLLLPAAAQTTTDGTTVRGAVLIDQPVMNNTNPPDAGGPPAEAVPGQTAPDDGTEIPPTPPAGSAPTRNQPIVSTVILPKGNAPEAVPSAFTPPALAMGGNSNDLNLNFNHAPLEMILSYLSDAAGFIIVQDTHVNGTVTVVGQHLTQDEAVNLLNTELNRNNYAAIRDGRTLTIVDKNDAKTRNIPVKTGNRPGDIPDNAEIATWIIPIRFVEARQLVSDLSTFVSPQATIVANEAGNSVVVTDTQSNIRHLAEIIQAVDNSAEAETEIRVFRLKYASPTDVATELGSVFPSSSSSGNQAPIQFGGRGGGFGGGRGGFGGGFNPFAAAAAGGTGNNSQQRIQKATQVTAVADSRIQAVIVTAPKDLMEEIAGMMADLDVPSDRDQGVYVFQMMNGDPQQAVQVLQNMFQSSSTSRSGTSSSSSQNSALQQRAQNSTTSMGTTTTTSGIGGTGAGGGGGGTAGRQF
jgi:type II secretory pathway component GspD/PulD (secretin)